MANRISLTTNGDMWILELDSDPSIGLGFDAPIGSEASVNISGVGSKWEKFGPNPTDWRNFSDETFDNIITTKINVNGDATLANLIIPSLAIVTSLNGTLNLTSSDKSAQLFTGSALGYSVVMPDATTLPQGHKYELYNTTSTVITIKTFGGTTLFSLQPNSTAYLYLRDNTSQAGLWLAWQITSDPSIALGILSYKLTSSTTFTTSSTTDVPITGFSITPNAGTYAIWYNGSITLATNNAIHRGSIYKNGAIITDSTRPSQASGGSWSGNNSTITTATFNGTEACDVRVRSSSGSTSVLDRTLIMIRLGP